MKRFYVILLCLVAFAQVNAQEKGASFNIGYRSSLAISDKDALRTSDFAMAIGYNFNSCFTLSGQVEIATNLFKEEGIKTYEQDGTLGVLAGYNFGIRENSFFEVNASVGNSLGESKWQYMYYDVGVRMNVGRHKTRLMYGVGFRYYNSHKSIYDNYSNIYATVGLRFN